MSLTDDFEQAQTDAKALPSRPSNDVLLRLYALYKQGTQGDATGSRPGIFDQVGRAKYDAWKAVAGTSQEDAQRDYVALVNSLRS
ncbi:acyl-CoA-binding protein [Dactylosporangium sp. NPDC005572]|uniref:acyl-CoA-binding protein n=1 Tax=Dactylosporangium sp. NPDC005572 TaxID=3156889 RepID=UPI0033B1AA53